MSSININDNTSDKSSIKKTETVRSTPDRANGEPINNSRSPQSITIDGSTACPEEAPNNSDSPGLSSANADLELQDSRPEKRNANDSADSGDSKDAVIGRKINLINDALDEIGLTYHHLKLFLVAGFGYSIDAQMEMIQSAVKQYVDAEMLEGKDHFPLSNIIFYVGLTLGALILGIGSDILGRKMVFNASILLTSVFGIITAFVGNYFFYNVFMGLSAFAAGGNLCTDISVFLEYLPSKYQYLNTTMALFWGVGQSIAALLSWVLIPGNACDLESNEKCNSEDNKGWRYCWLANSAICLIAAVLRICLIKLDETPKYLVTVGNDEEAFHNIGKLANSQNKKISLTLKDFLDCGEIEEHRDEHKPTLKSMIKSIFDNFAVLFQNKRATLSTILVFASWSFIGLAYSTFYNYLYIFIASHSTQGETSTESSTYITYRNGLIANFAGIFGPILAGFMILIKFKVFQFNITVGRRGTLAFGALLTMAVMFGYTFVTTPNGDAVFGALTYFAINTYYGTLYAYTPEVFPTRARGTGIGLSMVLGRVFGLFAPAVYYFGAKASVDTPIWISGSVIGALSIISAFLPFEPSLERVL